MAPCRVGKRARREVGRRLGRHTLTKVVTPQSPTVVHEETKAKIERPLEVTQ